MSGRTPLDPPALAGYAYLDRLGSGGFSDVFLYEREFPRQKVAIKVLAADGLGEDGRERFNSEANVMASLSTHPYIVAIYQADISPEGHPYLVMQYYPRPNFNVRARTERFAVAAVLRAGVQIASAVETAHRSEVLHRDIKPANILTSDYGQPGLTDFGIASAADARDLEAEGMSIPWSPPEVVAGSGLTDERADIYSLAATLYTLLAGRSPFEVTGGSNRSIDLIDRIRRSRPAPFERGDVPDSLWRLLLQAMAKDPDARPASAADFARSLQVIEVEERFDMTPFEVSDAHADVPESEALDADAGSTRVKSLNVIESQLPDSTQSSGATSTSHDAFRPAETVMRTSKRPPGSVPAQAGPRPDLIHHSPYVPSAQPAPVVTPATAASAAHQAPTSGSYTAAQPVAAPRSNANKASPVVIAAAVVGALVVIAGILVLTGIVGGSEDTATTRPSQAKPNMANAKVTVAPAADGEAGSYVVAWERPEHFDPSTDRIVLRINDLPAQTASPKDRSMPYQSDDPEQCVIVTVERDKQPVGNPNDDEC